MFLLSVLFAPADGAGVGALLVLVGVVAFVLMAILLPFSAYAAQKWAYRCHKELAAINEKLDRLQASPPTS